MSENNSLFGIKDVSIIKGIQGTTINNIQESLKFDFEDNSFIVDSNYFHKKYFHKLDGDIKNEDKYLYIKISLYMKLKLRFNLQGASEDYIYQGSDKKSLVIPIEGEKLQYYDETKESKEKKKPKDYKTFYDLLDGNDFLLEGDLNNKIFKKFFYNNSIGFKAVNYRKGIYTGDKDNFLDGDNKFKTDIEKNKYFRTEAIQSILIVFLKSNEKYYLFNKKDEIGFFKQTIKKDFKELDLYKDKYMEKYKEIQLIFFEFEFNGKLLKLKKSLIDKKEYS